MATKNILITGPPGVGKTTLIKKVSEDLAAANPVGFYTEEIREAGIRKGFTLTSFDGTRSVLAHTDTKSSFRVSKYRVNVTGFEAFLDTIGFQSPAHSVVIIDEIGKMECFSDKFKSLLEMLLDSSMLLIATIAMKGGGIIEQTKRRQDVTIYEITRANRDSLASEIVELAGRLSNL